MAVLLVALGGGLGSVTRYLVGGWVANRFGVAFPYGTLLINITASFIVAFFLTFAQERAALNPNWRLFIAVGFVGGYSTFSIFECLRPAWEFSIHRSIEALSKPSRRS